MRSGMRGRDSTRSRAIMTMAIVVAAAACGAHAQGPAKPATIAYIGFQGDNRETKAMQVAYLARLRELGYGPGGSVRIEARTWTSVESLRFALEEIARARPDLIFVGPPLAAVEARKVTRNIPIVCGSCGDPVENGLAQSLARPGGNVTGMASLSAELIGKRLAILKELLPRVTLVAVFVYPANPGTPATLKALDAASQALKVGLLRLEVRREADFEQAFQAAVAGGAGAVFLQDDPLNRAAARQLGALATRHRLPVSSGIVEVADAGALLSYGPDRIELVRRAAEVSVTILKGAKPADTPFEQAAKFEFVLNLRAARSIGLTIPNSFLVRADRTIE